MKYRKKPVVIDAFRWTGDIEAFVLWLNEPPREKSLSGFIIHEGDQTIGIKTLEGTMTASWGDWIIEGVQGEMYPCKPDIFEQTYEPVDSPAND